MKGKTVRLTRALSLSKGSATGIGQNRAFFRVTLGIPVAWIPHQVRNDGLKWSFLIPAEVGQSITVKGKAFPKRVIPETKWWLAG